MPEDPLVYTRETDLFSVSPSPGTQDVPVRRALPKENGCGRSSRKIP